MARLGFALSVALFASSPMPAAEAPAAPEIVLACYENLFGVGACTPTSCPGTPQLCDELDPCADGDVCVFDPSCGPASFCRDFFGLCSNPGTAPAPCDAPIYGQDFASVGSFPSGIQCGTGGDWFKEEAAACGALAPSPLDHLRFGLAPANCGAYASSGVRTMTESGLDFDLSGCAGGVLEFDYLADLAESGNYDRAFVTIAYGDGFDRVVAATQRPGEATSTTQSLSCGGGILPVGGLIADGTWRHFRIGLGDSGAVEIKFWAETADNIFNDGKGFLVDDFRVDCGDHIFANGFEAVNVLAWSDSLGAPAPLFRVEPAGTCDSVYLSCGGPESGCFNFKGADGLGWCVNSTICGDTCASNADCGAGEICLVDTCCENDLAGSTCAPARCDPEAVIVLAEPAAAGAPTTVGALRAPLVADR